MTSNSRKNSKSQNSLIYVGPPVKGLARYSLFTNGYPKIHEEHKANCPAFTAMFIEPKKLPEFEKKISNPNSAESIFYHKVSKYFSEVK